MKEIVIAVRQLVEFVLRSGDIKTGGMPGAKDAMLEGGRIHRKLQRSMGSSYQSEVPLSFRKEYETFALTVEGRADGIYKVRGLSAIDEIKGTMKDIDKLEEPVPVHLAQAVCYAFIFAHENHKEKMQVQVRYCHFSSEKIKKFVYKYTYEELKSFFDDILNKYYRWAEFAAGWEETRNGSVKGLEFPFDYRPGQQKLTADVYRTILRSKQLFVQAATGTGKTMSVVFPAVHALGEGLAERVFYLTAKTVAGSVAGEALDILRDNGLRIKSLYMTAKEKICPFTDVKCDAEFCERAKGHFDRINDALYDLLSEEESFARENIIRAAGKASVCPYEMQSDLANFSDVIICDYNYAFDPEARLKKFFSENARKNEVIFLIDECHNLVERGRNMFSASVSEKKIALMSRIVKNEDKKLYGALQRCGRILKAIKETSAEKPASEIEFDEKLEFSLLAVSSLITDFFEENNNSAVKDELLEFYFDILHYLGICELVDENYMIIGENADGDDFKVKLYCVNPAANLQKVFDIGRSSVLFSATLLPIRYYQDLLSKQEKYAVYIRSPFKKENRIILNGTDISSRYKSRGQASYEKISRYLKYMTESKQGNYMAYFPSYQMMQDVYDVFCSMKHPSLEAVIQRPSMDEQDKEEFLSGFSLEDTWKIGFCVLGGIFSEGIDLTGDRLIGAAVIGTGLPKVTEETDLLKAFYDRKNTDGFDYAYKYPGMNKVQQAAGRVIRTTEDRGIILLLDDRFTQQGYRSLFPREWDDVMPCDINSVESRLKDFWNRFKN